VQRYFDSTTPPFFFACCSNATILHNNPVHGSRDLSETPRLLSSNIVLSNHYSLIPNRVWVCPALLKQKMVSRLKSAHPVDLSLSGAKNGNAIGKTLSTVPRNVNQNDKANPLYSI
jgi:hypothetical protein